MPQVYSINLFEIVTLICKVKVACTRQDLDRVVRAVNTGKYPEDEPDRDCIISIVKLIVRKDP
jgi:hypothetical protein